VGYFDYLIRQSETIKEKEARKAAACGPGAQLVSRLPSRGENGRTLHFDHIRKANLFVRNRARLGGLRDKCRIPSREDRRGLRRTRGKKIARGLGF